MQRFLIMAICGLAAQLVDGSLGMAYGLTSTTLLLGWGLSPVTASASIHLVEVGTTLIAGLSHWRFGNVDWRTVAWLALPGGGGAFVGALVLVSLPMSLSAPWVASFLICLGIYVLFRFSFGRTKTVLVRPVSRRILAPLGFGAGFFDAAGGSGWGPIATPSLLSSGRMQPRKVIGTVDTSEFVVAICASAGFLIALNRSSVALPVVAALLFGGMLAAPLAAWLVRYLHPRILGSAVGGMIVMMNSHVLMRELDVAGDVRMLIYLGLGTFWAVTFIWTLLAVRADRPKVAELATQDKRVMLGD